MAARIDHPAVREQVRLLYIANGGNLTLAAKTVGVPIDRAEKWKERGSWKTRQPEHDQLATSESVGRTADTLETEINEHERQTRASLARYSRKAAKDAETSSLRDSPYVHKAAQVAGITFKWDQKSGPTTNVMVNVALMGVDPSNVQAQTLDAEPAQDTET